MATTFIASFTAISFGCFGHVSSDNERGSSRFVETVTASSGAVGGFGDGFNDKGALTARMTFGALALVVSSLDGGCCCCC